MGNLEQISKRRKKRQNIQEAILLAVEAVGVLSLAAVAPNTTLLLKSFGYDPRRRQKEIITRARERLLKEKLLIYKNGFLMITPKGEEKLNSFKLQNWELAKPKKWDGRWRMLIFDIPEKRRLIRNSIRRTLVRIGFQKIQQSVWIFPYDCEDFVTLLKSNFRIGKDVLYVIVDSMENDKVFRKMFSLPIRVV